MLLDPILGSEVSFEQGYALIMAFLDQPGLERCKRFVGRLRGDYERVYFLDVYHLATTFPRRFRKSAALSMPRPK